MTVRSERAELRLPMRALVVPYDGSGLVPVNDGTHPLVHTMPTPHEARAPYRDAATKFSTPFQHPPLPALARASGALV